MRHITAAVISFNALFACSALAVPGGWQPALQLSSPITYDGDGAVGIDPNGNGLSVWSHGTKCGANVCYSLLSRALPSGGKPGPVETITMIQPFFDAYSPTLFVNDAGTGTLLWYDQLGVETADKPLNQSWSAPKLLQQNAAVQNLAYGGDHVGDVAVLVNNRDVLLRREGGTWHDAGIAVPASFSYVDSNASVVVSASGTVAVLWYSYKERCYHHDCVPYSFGLHISTLDPGASTWNISNFFPGQDQASYADAIAAIDDAGRIGFITGSPQGVIFVGQSVSGEIWNATVIVSPPGSVFDLQSNKGGDLTALLSDGSLTTIFTGEMKGGQWMQTPDPFGPYPLLPQNQPTPILAVSPSGSAVLSWVYMQSTSSTTNMVVATVRPSADANWQAPQVISPSSQPNVRLVAAKANGVNRAILGWWLYTTLPSGAFYFSAGVHTP